MYVHSIQLSHQIVTLLVDLIVLVCVGVFTKHFSVSLLTHVPLLSSIEDAEEDSEGESAGEEDEVGLDYLNKDFGSVRPSLY